MFAPSGPATTATNIATNTAITAITSTANTATAITITITITITSHTTFDAWST